MAEEQTGLGKEQVHEPAPWTKIFTGFRVAADPKKLLLAAAGIFVMALGWWVLATFFYNFNYRAPRWAAYEKDVGESRYKDNDEAFKSYKQALNNWNLLHKLAGPSMIEDYTKPGMAEKAADYHYTVADYSSTYKQFAEAQRELQSIREDTDRANLPVKIQADPNKPEQVFFVLDTSLSKVEISVRALPGAKFEILNKELAGKLRAKDLSDAYLQAKDGTTDLKGFTLTLPKDAMPDWQKLQAYVSSPKTLSQIEDEIIEGKRKDAEGKLVDPEATRIALKVLRQEREQVFKPSGELATWPWNEYRGPNPYLVVTDPSAVALSKTSAPVSRAEVILHWLVDQIPVLLEPLIKFLSPVVYFLHPAAGFWTRIYLLLVILWTIITWSLFGSAITRMAVVQVARPTERVGMVEALRFAVSRYRAFVASQLLPFAFLAGLALLLMIYGFFEILIPLVGDVVIAGLGFPIVLLLGLVMAVVLIGLTGWPLMYATISAEGSDSFDAISRSYSYVYQAPWHYLWYSFLALVYGAVLVFFVGLMGSLLVYLGKFGMSLPSGMWPDREPSYLYQFAPTSYGWRDLLLYQSPHAESHALILNTGRVVPGQVLKPAYYQSLNSYNVLGAGMVAFWLYLLFLMIIGFGYSFFWTASSIIYLLMRRKVDDTELDEVHLEEEEIDMPAHAPAGAPVAATATPGRTTVPLNVVEGPPTPPTGTQMMPQAATPAPMPPVRPADGEPPGHAPSMEPGAPSYSTDLGAPPASPKRTQLAPGGPLEGDEHRPDEPGHGMTPG